MQCDEEEDVRRANLVFPFVMENWELASSFPFYFCK